MADACTGCPDYILSAVRAPVQLALDQLLAIKKLTNVLNNLLESLAEGVAPSVSAVVDAIPTAPVFDLSEILDTLTCPLTPVALFLNASDLAKLDARELYTSVQDILTAHIERITTNYDTALAALEDFSVVAIAKRSFADLKRIQLDEVNYARAIAITAFVKTTCPEEFEAGPYARFETESTGFSLDDLIPTDLGPNGKALMDELQRAENKLLAWRALSTAPAGF